MEGNLTLRINESILKKAIRYAHKNKIDLSVVIEDFLAKFVADKEVQEKKVVVSDEVKEILGSADSDTWKEERAEYLTEKYK